MTRKRINVLGLTAFTDIFTRYPIAVTGQVDAGSLQQALHILICAALRRHGGQWSQSRLRRCNSRRERGEWHLTKKLRLSRGRQRTCQTTGEGRVDCDRPLLHQSSNLSMFSPALKPKPTRSRTRTVDSMQKERTEACPISGQNRFMNERYYRSKNFNKNSNKTKPF